jgi:hypothetical protein
MATLLIVTVGQTDVQLVADDGRQEFEKDCCAVLHDAIEEREGDWDLVDTPENKLRVRVQGLPAGKFRLCTPKLDAVLEYLQDKCLWPASVLVLETRRKQGCYRPEPRYAGCILERRLTARGATNVVRVAYLQESERLEQTGVARDAIVRHEVVERLDTAVRERVGSVNPDTIVLATTGGMPTATRLIEEVVQLHGGWQPGADRRIDLLEVPDGSGANLPGPDKAVPRPRALDPVASYQTRRRALEMITGGDLLGAWGAVRHLHDTSPEDRRWTRIVQWLARFAASLPLPSECDAPQLRYPRPAARMALRVEFALRAGNIPQAVLGTVAFFEAALWDHLDRFGLKEGPPAHGKRLYRAQVAPAADLVVVDEDKPYLPGTSNRPFWLEEQQDGVCWYQVDDSGVCASRLAASYLQRPALHRFGVALEGLRRYRNDIAHNEPTPALIAEARGRMVARGLWSDNVSDPSRLSDPPGPHPEPNLLFLGQALVTDELADYGLDDPPGTMHAALMNRIRDELLKL